MNPNSGDTGGILKDDWTSVEKAKIDIIKPYLAPQHAPFKVPESPSTQPSEAPSAIPSVIPSINPSVVPSIVPTDSNPLDVNNDGYNI
jgi:endoglucanase